MTARSVVLSVLLGAHPAWATASELIRLTADFDIKESTLRVALTRMVSAGDLVRSEDGYRLSDRLLARQRRQDDAINPQLRPWDGTWTTLVITSVGIDARTRAALANHPAAEQVRRTARRCVVASRQSRRSSCPGDVSDSGARAAHPRRRAPAELAARLWDLPRWARTGRELLDDMAAAIDIPARFVAAAGMVRHLLTDPVLPDELLPDEWPGDRDAGGLHGTSRPTWWPGATSVELMEAR